MACNLYEYCVEFCDKWLWASPHAEKYRRGNVVCYTNRDFIKYLFPGITLRLVETLENI